MRALVLHDIHTERVLLPMSKVGAFFLFQVLVGEISHVYTVVGNGALGYCCQKQQKLFASKQMESRFSHDRLKSDHVVVIVDVGALTMEEFFPGGDSS